MNDIHDMNDIVFLLDVDNTLLDNDQITADLRGHLERQFGAASAQRYWVIFEHLRQERGYADYLGALQRYRLEAEQDIEDDARLLQMSSFLIDYPFANRLYPQALEVVKHLSTLGPTVILSDGDVVFQPHKVLRSGLWAAVEGRVLIYLHKEQRLDAVQRHFPARHYVVVDDKLRLLAEMKSILQERLTSVFPRQGHYAMDPTQAERYPPADISVEHIGDLMQFQAADFLEKRP